MSEHRRTIVLAMGLLVLGCDPDGDADRPQLATTEAESRGLIGTWETDADLTETLAQNRPLDPDKLRTDSWLFGIQMKRQQTFSPGGRYAMELRKESTDFTYRVVRRDGDRITLQCQIVVDPALVKYAEEGAFEPFQSEWLILGKDRIANQMKGESGEFWLVYRRLGKAGSFTPR